MINPVDTESYGCMPHITVPRLHDWPQRPHCGRPAPGDYHCRISLWSCELITANTGYALCKPSLDLLHPTPASPCGYVVTFSSPYLLFLFARQGRQYRKISFRQQICICILHRDRPFVRPPLELHSTPAATFSASATHWTSIQLEDDTEVLSYVEYIKSAPFSSVASLHN